jgi:uncharacterized protein YcfJ
MARLFLVYAAREGPPKESRMNNTVLAGIIVGGVVLAAAGSIVASSGYNPLQKYATVVSVEPAFDTTRTPRQLCGDEATVAQASVTGDTAAAAAPTPAPATEPTKPEQARAPKAGSAEADTSAECIVVYDTSSVQAGFDVTYELDGAQKVVRMDRDPGKRIPVEDGELVLSSR